VVAPGANGVPGRDVAILAVFDQASCPRQWGPVHGQPGAAYRVTVFLTIGSRWLEALASKNSSRTSGRSNALLPTIMRPLKYTRTHLFRSMFKTGL
jgi:hypothetical protein